MLMGSVMMTGYMFKGAEERLRLRNALGGGSSSGGGGGGGMSGGIDGGAGAWRGDAPAVPGPARGAGQQQAGGGGSGGGGGGVLDDRMYAPGVQKSRVQVRGPGGWIGGPKPAVSWGAGPVSGSSTAA
jgi:hypothetical protein